MFSQLLAISGVLATARASGPTHWFLFGDSYTQTLFNQSGAQPNDINPFGNPAMPGITGCGRDAPNYVYYASTKYNTSVVYTYNFARSGATINESIIPPTIASFPSVVQQVDAFSKTYAGRNPTDNLSWTGANSLFSLWIGVNDVGRSYNPTDPTFNQSKLHDELISSYIANLQTLYDLGARRFLILNVPPTDRSPQILLQKPVYREKLRVAVIDFNAKLAVGLSGFLSANPAVTVRSVDVHALVTRILDDPQQYGFVDAVTYGPADGLAWCNGYHVSPRVHDYVAQAVRASLRGPGLLERTTLLNLTCKALEAI